MNEHSKDFEDTFMLLSERVRNWDGRDGEKEIAPFDSENGDSPFHKAYESFVEKKVDATHIRETSSLYRVFQGLSVQLIANPMKAAVITLAFSLGILLMVLSIPADNSNLPNSAASIVELRGVIDEIKETEIDDDNLASEYSRLTKLAGMIDEFRAELGDEEAARSLYSASVPISKHLLVRSPCKMLINSEHANLSVPVIKDRDEVIAHREVRFQLIELMKSSTRDQSIRQTILNHLLLGAFESYSLDEPEAASKCLDDFDSLFEQYPGERLGEVELLYVLLADRLGQSDRVLAKAKSLLDDSKYAGPRTMLSASVYRAYLTKNLETEAINVLRKMFSDLEGHNSSSPLRFVCQRLVEHLDSGCIGSYRLHDLLAVCKKLEEEAARQREFELCSQMGHRRVRLLYDLGESSAALFEYKKLDHSLDPLNGATVGLLLGEHSGNLHVLEKITQDARKSARERIIASNNLLFAHLRPGNQQAVKKLRQELLVLATQNQEFLNGSVSDTLAQAYLYSNDLDNALTWGSHAVAQLEKGKLQENNMISFRSEVEIRSNYATLLAETGKLDESIECLQQQRRIAIKYFGSDSSPLVAAINHNLAVRLSQANGEPANEPKTSLVELNVLPRSVMELEERFAFWSRMIVRLRASG